MAITAHDIVSDSPTNNFATLNSIHQDPHTKSQGNLQAYYNAAWASTLGTIAPSTGKWYFEAVLTVKSWQIFGVDQPYIYGVHVGATNGSKGLGFIFDPSNTRGDITYNGNNNAYDDGNLGISAGDIVSIAMDLDNNNVKFYLNNVLKYSLSNLLEDGANYTFGMSLYNSTAVVNFGQDPTFAGNKSPTTTYTDANDIGAFFYQPPTGALALCTANLRDFTPDVTGDTPQDYFKAVLYTGNGTSQSITGVGFQPDLVWAKSRNDTTGHRLFDIVRGDYNFLESNSTNAESNNTNQISLDADGFTTGSSVNTNSNGKTYVAWCWKAGGNSNTFNINGTGYSTYSALQTANTSLPASSTSGMIVPSGMSINTDAGFSIIKYTGNNTAGATIPHGLSSAPDMIIIKSRTEAVGWYVYHSSNTSAPETDFLRLDENFATVDNIGPWDDTAPSSTVFTLGDGGSTNRNTEDYIAYCWHSVEGYSKFGSYVGNGSADGPMVYCGFRPAWVMVKRTDGTSSWVINDTKRSPYNLVNKSLFADLSNNEDSIDVLDFLSNGFKLKVTTRNNASSGTYIFMAFAEQPFKFSNAR